MVNASVAVANRWMQWWQGDEIMAASTPGATIWCACNQVMCPMCPCASCPTYLPTPYSRAGRSLKKVEKKVFRNQFSQKSPRALHVLNHGWWRLAVGSWRRLAVGSWQLAVGGGWWWLAAVGGW